MSSVRLVIALSLLTACGNDFDVEVEPLEEMGSMLKVSWTTDEPGASWVEYGTGGELDLSTPVVDEGATEHEFYLLGLPFLAETTLRAFTDTGERTLAARSRATTGGRPSDLPGFTVNNLVPERMSKARYLMGAIFGTSPAIFIIERGGSWVWYHQESPDLQVVDTAFLEGTNQILYNSFPLDRTVDDGQIHRVSMDKKDQESIQTPYAHHAFTQLPDGSLAYMAIDVRAWEDPDTGEMSPVVGDCIKVVTADGESSTLFSTWDWAEPEKHDLWDGGFYPQGKDWTHGNALSYEEENDSLIISFRNLNLFLELDWQTGAVLRQYGGDGGFSFAEGSHVFKEQHEPQFTSKGTIITISTYEETIGVEYEVDYDRELLTEVWSYGEGEGIDALAKGGMVELDNGNRLVNFGGTGVLKEVTADGELVWEMRGKSGVAFGKVNVVDDLYEGR